MKSERPDGEWREKREGGVDSRDRRRQLETADFAPAP